MPLPEGKAMQSGDVETRRHDHVFLGHSHRHNERRAWAVMALTAAMMVVELGAGELFGSMALIADGWHMATHTGALGVTAAAYFFARRHQADPAFTFGTGKFGDLAGFSSAVALGLISLFIAWQSLWRLFSPVAINFDDAIVVAAAGLLVNIASALLLRERHSHAESETHHDHNLRSARLHVLADALTSILALVALIAGRTYGWIWMDPLMGIVGSIVIARWSYKLVGATSRVLLDAQPSADLDAAIRRAIEESGPGDSAGDRVADLHVWRVGPGHLAAIVSLVTDRLRPADEFKRRLAGFGALAHVTIEVNLREGAAKGASPPAAA